SRRLLATGYGGQLGAGRRAFPVAGSVAVRSLFAPAGQDFVIAPALGGEVGVVVGVVVAVGEDGAGGFHAVLLGVDGCDTRMNALPAREAKRFLLGFPFRSNHAIR